MTSEAIDQRDAGPELNAMVAVETMGWEIRKRGRRVYRPDTGFECQGFAGLAECQRWIQAVCPKYSTDIAAAWEVHQEVQKRIFSVRQRYYKAIQLGVASRMGLDCIPAWPDVFGLIEPIDICRAALKAVGGSC